jgi:hypothetical protein
MLSLQNVFGQLGGAMRALTMLIGLAALIGCYRPIPMDKSARESLRTIQEIKVSHYAPADFFAPPRGQGAGIVGGPVIGGVIDHLDAQDHGHQIVKDFGLTDPIVKVKNSFLSSIRTAFAQATVSELSAPLSDDDLKQLKKEMQSGYLLDFKTFGWGIRHNPFRDYSFVLYQGRARLVNISEEKIIWQGVCILEEKDPTAKPSTKDFEIDNGALLKNYLAKAGTACTVELQRQFSETYTHVPVFLNQTVNPGLSE